MSKSKRRSASDGARLVARYQESGLTQKKFAATNNVTVSALQYWIRKNAKPGFQGGKGSDQNAARFVEVVRESSPEARGLSMSIGSGVTLQFDSLPSPEYLVSLVAALTQATSC